MRENPLEVAHLIELIRLHSPIRVSLLPWAIDQISEKSPTLRSDLAKPQRITDASYLGDIGGIICTLGITLPADVAAERGGDAILASITGLMVDPRTPIFREIQRYQKWRMKGLRQGLYDLDEELL